jgi:glycosyltransferase involved in cell wall biosynthesis
MAKTEAGILVVMPAYNSEKTIAEAIQSILKQTHKNLRLYIVDDCSTDNTHEIATRYTADKRVTVLRNTENLGAYYSRNAGLYYGRSYQWQYFTTHDADDVSRGKRYETLLKALQKTNVNAVQDQFLRVKYPDLTPISEELTIAHAVFKKRVFAQLGYFEETRFGADWEYWHRLTVLNALNNQTTKAVQYQLGQSYITGNNLTTLVPIGSKARREYIQQTIKNVKAMAAAQDFYRPADIDKIKRITQK